MAAVSDLCAKFQEFSSTLRAPKGSKIISTRKDLTMRGDDWLVYWRIMGRVLVSRV